MNNDPQTYSIIGAAMAAYRELGNGFLEMVYHEGLEIEFIQNKIPYKYEVELPIFYKGKQMNKRYRADFICFDNIIVEIKALPKLTGVEESQVINFGAPQLEYKRFINSQNNLRNLRINPLLQSTSLKTSPL